MSNFLQPFEALKEDHYNWSLVDLDYCSIDNMSDKELRESIIEDLFIPTICELENNGIVEFTMSDLLKWIPIEKQQRVMDHLEHEEIKFMIEVTDQSIRIRKDPTILDAAQEYCGVFYPDFYTKKLPDDLIFCAPEVMKENLEKFGSIENMATSLAMDLVTKNQELPKTVH